MGWALTLHLVRDEFHKAFAGFFDQIQHMLKALVATVVRVGDDRGLRGEQKLRQAPNLVLVLRGASFFQEGAVVPIHGQEQIKGFKVTVHHRPGPQVRKLVASFERMLLAAFIGRRIGVKVVCACRVNLDFVQEVLLSQPFEENSFGCGASADVAHADKQDFVSVFVHVVRGQEVGVGGQKDLLKAYGMQLSQGQRLGAIPPMGSGE